MSQQICYRYMGHPFNFTGVYKTSKHDSRFHLYRLRDTIEVGWTWFTEKEIDQILNHLKASHLGCDYHPTKKNSVSFARSFLEQLSNEINFKQIKSIELRNFPSCKIEHRLKTGWQQCSATMMIFSVDIDRCRRWSDTLPILQYFDHEKDIAEINILYFLYMKYGGNLSDLCRAIKCDTMDRVSRTIVFIFITIRSIEFSSNARFIWSDKALTIRKSHYFQRFNHLKCERCTNVYISMIKIKLKLVQRMKKSL